MMKRLRRYASYYVVLLMVLAALGANNQRLHREQWQMIDQKKTLQLELSTLHAQEAAYFGAPAVRVWALARGMIAAPEGASAGFIFAEAAPAVELFTPVNELEIVTVW
ncbi:MAG: hypothetical protein AAF267_22605 [Deinococcota bacterium]